MGKALIVCLLFFASPICFAANFSQQHEENRLIGSLALRFNFFRSDHPSQTPTNLLQVFEEITNLFQLVPLQESLKKFGTNSGFDNNVLEKYVFMPRGVVADDSIGGEIVLISARTFPSEDGSAMRAIIARMPDRFRGFVAEDYRIERWLAKAGAAIPAPPKLPPLPPPPPKERTLDDIPNDEIERVLDAAAARNAATPPSRWPTGSKSTATNDAGQTGTVAQVGSSPSLGWLWALLLLSAGICTFILLRARSRK